MQRRALFVAMIRARGRLALTCGGAPAAAVEAASWSMERREY